MPSGLPNKEKQRVRQLYAEGKSGRTELLEAESRLVSRRRHLHLLRHGQLQPDDDGSDGPAHARCRFRQSGNAARQALTRAAIHRLAEIAWNGANYRPLGVCVDEKAIVNAIVGLLATGGSTNHAIHLPAIARAAGIAIDWEDFDCLSSVVPLIARIYPNGSGDINQFQQAGGMAFVIGELLEAGLLHRDIVTVAADDLGAYADAPQLEEEKLVWKERARVSRDKNILRSVKTAFGADGGMRLVSGNLGRAIFKTSAVEPSRWTVEAPARVFSDQDEVLAAFRRGELDRDVVVVVRFQGPRANGMPELHKLSPSLSVLQDKGFKVALVTDGRMSGASGKVPAAIHVSPEALRGGAIAKLQDGDMIRLCAIRGELLVLAEDGEWMMRTPALPPPPASGTGRELFAMFREGADGAEQGASAMLNHARL